MLWIGLFLLSLLAGWSELKGIANEDDKQNKE